MKAKKQINQKEIVKEKKWDEHPTPNTYSVREYEQMSGHGFWGSSANGYQYDADVNRDIY